MSWIDDTRRNPWKTHPVIYNTDNPYSIRFGASPYAGYFQNATPRAVQGNLPGNFFAPVPMPQYQPQVPPTQNRPYYQPTPVVNNNPNAVQDFKDAVLPWVVPAANYVGNQLVQNALMRGGTGTTLGNVVTPAIGYAAARFAPSLTNAARKAGKFIDWFF